MNHFEIVKEEMAFYGQENTSLQNLLAVLIGPQADPSTTGKLASLGIDKLCKLTIEELMVYPGISESIAHRIYSAFGLASYIRKFKRATPYIVLTPNDAVEYFSYLEGESQECLDAIFLTMKNQVISRKNISKGTVNAAIFSPREIFREAVKLGAVSVICAHNHLSGDPTPSKEDIESTRRIVDAGKIVGVELLDHIIIGHNGKYVSLKEKRWDIFNV